MRWNYTAFIVELKFYLQGSWSDCSKHLTYFLTYSDLFCLFSLGFFRCSLGGDLLKIYPSCLELSEVFFHLLWVLLTFWEKNTFKKVLWDEIRNIMFYFAYERVTAPFRSYSRGNLSQVFSKHGTQFSSRIMFPRVRGCFRRGWKRVQAAWAFHVTKNAPQKWPFLEAPGISETGSDLEITWDGLPLECGLHGG